MEVFAYFLNDAFRQFFGSHWVIFFFGGSLVATLIVYIATNRFTDSDIQLQSVNRPDGFTDTDFIGSQSIKLTNGSIDGSIIQALDGNGTQDITLDGSPIRGQIIQKQRND